MKLYRINVCKSGSGAARVSSGCSLLWDMLRHVSMGGAEFYSSKALKGADHRHLCTDTVKRRKGRHPDLMLLTLARVWERCALK